jgi:hypothetical protein
MAFRKLKIGQIVHYRPNDPRQNALRGAYGIINLLPQREDGEFEYRIRRLEEQHELVAKESELMTSKKKPPSQSRRLRMRGTRCPTSLLMIRSIGVTAP